ncbi:MAG: PspA/IM30 family protein [Chloroflexota bacterium]
MGILDRVSTILRSNVNAMLDAAEDPEKMIDQIIRDQEDGIRQARVQVTEMLAEQKRLEAESEHNEKLSGQWGQKAELAVRKNADDLAREALRRQKDYEDAAQVYSTQFAGQKDAVDKLKTALRSLEEKFEATKRQRDVLIARHRRAHAQAQVQKVSAALSTTDPTAELKRMEDRIGHEEALAEARAELESDTFDKRFQELEGDTDLEDRLSALKAKVQVRELPSPASQSEGGQAPEQQ